MTWRRTLRLRNVNRKKDTIELIANEMYDKTTTLINKRRKRLGIKGGAKYHKL